MSENEEMKILFDKAEVNYRNAQKALSELGKTIDEIKKHRRDKNG